MTKYQDGLNISEGLMQAPTVSSHLFNELIRIIEQRGIDSAALLKEFQLPASVTADMDARIPVEQVARVYDRTAELLNAPLFGLDKGLQSTPFSLGPIMNILLNSPNLGTAFKYSRRYLKVFSEEFEYKPFFTSQYFGLRFISPPNTYMSYHQVYAAMGHALSICRWLYGENFNLIKIDLMTPAHGEDKDYIKFLGVLPTFNASTNILYFPKEALRRPLPWHSNQLQPVLDHTEEKLVSIFKQDTFKSQVIKIITDKLFMSKLSIDHVAQELNITRRTLQRRLKENNLVYRKLLDEVKRESAYKLLINKQHKTKSLTEIAFMLGYNDTSIFHKHFKRWAGIPPGKYRALHSNNSH